MAVHHATRAPAKKAAPGDDFRQRAELNALGYEQTESPSADVLVEEVSRLYEDGWVDLSPIEGEPNLNGRKVPTGLRLRAYYAPTRQLWDISDRLVSMQFSEHTGTAAMQGTLELDNTDGQTSIAMNRPGIQLLLETRQNARVPFVERYRFIAWETDVSDLNEATLSISFYDCLYYIQTATTSVGMIADGRHKGGWRCHEIAAYVLRQFKVPVGHLVTGTYRIPTFILHDTSIYNILAIAYSIERHEHGSQYYIVAEKGKVSVIRSNSLYGLMGKRLNRKHPFVISDRALNARPGAHFKRSLDQYAAGVIPTGGDANLVMGNQAGHVQSYQHSEGAREDRKRMAAKPHLNKQDQEILNAQFPPDPFTSTNPGASQEGAQHPGTNRQHANQLLASALLFGAISYQARGAWAQIGDPAYSKNAAQLLTNALSRAQKTLTVPILGNILLRVGMTVYVDLSFSAGRPLRKEIYIAGIEHSIEGGDFLQQVTLAWRESEVAIEQNLEGWRQEAKAYAEAQAQATGAGSAPGATNKGQGGPGAGVGGWVTVQASEFNDPGGGAFGGLQNPGYHYAELGTATSGGQATGHGWLARALGMPGEVGAGFKIQIEHNGKTVFATCEDRGFGSGDPHRAIDLYAPSGVCNALSFSGLEDVKVRPAQ
jgi:hypothetical protein